MNKSLHQQQMYSPGSSRQSISGNIGSPLQRARQILGSGITGSNGRKSLKKDANALPQSRFSVSGRSNQSFLGIRSDFNLVESYGFQLPVLVNEALTFAEKNQTVSVCCAENGWAWVVNSRRLLIWQFKDVRNVGTDGFPINSSRDLLARTNSQRRAGTMAQCRELTLPHCDIGHKAGLISVFLSEQQQMASCIAVSPAGDVRYWPSIAHDGSSIDLTNILDGQEFDRLLPLQQIPFSYLLVTTTCSLILLKIQIQNGRHVLEHKTIRQPSGFLGGIGKKFASIIIGMNSGHEKENKFVAIACETFSKCEPGTAIVLILSDRWIQCWRLFSNGQYDHLFEDTEIIRKIREEFHQSFWNIRENVDINLHLLDMHVQKEKIYILGGAINLSQSPKMHYAIVILTTSNEFMHFEKFASLKLSPFYSADTEKECLSLRFIICHTHIYLYNKKTVYPLALSTIQMGEIDAEKIEFHLQDDLILSAAVCTQIPLFFSRTHGLVSITQGDFDSTDFMNMNASFNPSTNMDIMNIKEQTLAPSNIDEQNLYIYELDPDAMYAELRDDVTQLKAAFVYRLKKNINMCNRILNELLKNISESRTDGALSDDNQLDKIVFSIAEELAEDIPAADPRWEQSWEDSNNQQRYALGSSSSMQILTQLKEKNLALRHFVEFLHATSLWDKLTALTISGGNIKPTCYAISDINEKIIAASSLRSLQNRYGKLIDEAINMVTQRWHESPQGNLTVHDLFYVRVCKFQEIFHTFCDLADERIETQHHTSTLVNFINDINTIVLSIISDIMEFREQNSTIYSLPISKKDSYEYLPWTAMSGNIGLRDALSHLIDISLKYGAHNTNDPELKQKIYQQILELIDIVLDGRKRYLDCVRDSEKYNVLLQQFESQRRDLISIMIEDTQYEYAAKLAEKYLDFHSLVVICDVTSNQERLDAYIKKYEDYDFSQFAINWHLRQNRRGEVFERFKSNQAALSQFMRDHPTLGWIQLIFNGDFERAAKILFQLAQNETEFVQRKKTILSLAKLSALAASDSDLTLQINTINIELRIIDYQEQLSPEILQIFGYEMEQQKVLRVEEIINLFIAEENETVNEFDFRKALELLDYLEEPYEARHKIWCAAILRDNWIDYDSNDVMNYLQNLLFVKLIELCHLMDGDFENFLPPMTEFLNSSNLGDLIHNKSFQYLLKFLYEYINDSLKSSDSVNNEKQNEYDNENESENDSPNVDTNLVNEIAGENTSQII